MEKIRYAIVGYGNMGSGHAKSLEENKVEHGELSAICDIDPAKIAKAKTEIGEHIAYFANVDDLFACRDKFDAIIIATPHYFHPIIAMQALKMDINTIIEKPAGVFTKKVREMNEVAAASKGVFGIMYNQRTNPLYQKVRQMIANGELGRIYRFNWIITNWYRSQSYYNSGGWRATWQGEGGGVLANQDPHQLDLWQWMMGKLPVKVRAFAGYGKMHNIEVEDDVTAYAEYEDGATALFVTSTYETPGTNRLEISGEMGKIVIEEGKLTFYKNVISEREFNATCTTGFGSPEFEKIEIEVAPDPESQHVIILENFANGVLFGEKLLAPGFDGINGLTVSNAIHLSSWTDEWVTLPIDEDLYYEKLQEKIKNSTFVKTEKKLDSVDLSNTYNTK